MPELNLKEYREWAKERDRALKGFRGVHEQQPVIDPVFGFEYAEDNLVDDLTKKLKDAEKKAQALNAENTRLRKQCETLASDNKHLENEANRLNQSLDAFAKIQIMDAAEIEHWKSTVEAIVKSDQKANYLPRTAIVSIAKNALKGVPK